MTQQIIVEGWRFLPHSYAVINQFQCLEFLKRAQIKLFHRDAPYLGSWSRDDNLFEPLDHAKLAQIEIPENNQPADITLRIEFPFRLESSQSKQTLVMMTSEQGCTPDHHLSPKCSLSEAHRNSDVTIITPSNWSKRGLIYGGADSERIVVIPHGIDPAIYHPLSAPRKQELRKHFGLDGFLFLNIGGMYPCKRIDLLLKAFARVLEKHPDARLVLKGLDALYNSENSLQKTINSSLSPIEAERVCQRLGYIGTSLSFREMAELYQLADAYVAPYTAEGFNIPVLEAAACGLPVICTKGGPTDDFTNSDFALYINSQFVEIPQWWEDRSAIMLEPDFEHLVELMHFVIEADSFRNLALHNGSQFIHQHFTWQNVVDQLLVVMQSNS